MIEKLEKDCGKLQKKINELVDAVNELHEEAKNNVRIRANHDSLIESLIIQNNIHEEQIDKLQAKVNKLAPVINFAQPKVKDKFAEQRKWVGMLCWFWNDDYYLKTVGVLEEISPIDEEFIYAKKDTCTVWKHCEPVKPDDDIIYKGA